jgi:RecB family exonuclease
LEAAYRAHTDDLPLAATASIAIDALRDAWVSEGLPDDPEWRARSEALVRGVLEQDRLDAREVIGVEHGFRADTDDGIRFGGFADLVLRRDATTVEIVDHKITRGANDQESLRTDPQLNLYGWFARQEWPWATRVLATHHYPVLDQIVTVELSDESMHATVTRLAGVARAAEADQVFAPRPGPECSSCPWFARCPAQTPAPSQAPERAA